MAIAADHTTDSPGTGSRAAGGSGAGSDEVDVAFGLIIDCIRVSPVDVGLGRVASYMNRLVAVQAELLAARRAAGESDRNIERRAGRAATVTKREAKKTARRAAAVELNPTLADDLATGALGVEQLDAIAAGAAKTDGAAALDANLVDKVKAASPDDAARIVNRWVDDNTSNKKKETQRDRQRRLRGVSRFTTKRDTDALLLEGDTAAIDEIERHLIAASKKLYLRDGGRDLPKSKHRRTRTQRMFDAAHQTLTRQPGITKTTGGNKTAAGGGGGPAATMFITTTLDDVISGDIRARLANGSRLPASIVDRLMCNGTIAGIVYDQHGEILWHGRDLRYATPAQYRALAARDGGCTLCQAPVQECEVHHLIPWHSLLKGETDTDKMALVCTDCHHYIHHNKTHPPQNQQRQMGHPPRHTPRNTPRPAPPATHPGATTRGPAPVGRLRQSCDRGTEGVALTEVAATAQVFAYLTNTEMNTHVEAWV